ncbi:MAG TPA: OsmC family protein [Cyclobacteriaceae bacterium]|nr:OsmC family protein [Cyclobacteriaceae bacterium]
MDTHNYHVDIAWSSDRRGMMCSPELAVSSGQGGCIEVATPPEFPKGIPGIWSPEHLFTASVSSCLMTTFLAIAENSKLNFTAFNCPSTGKLSQVDGKWLMTEVVLEPHVTIGNPDDRGLAERVLMRAESACLISNSIKSKIRMVPHIVVKNGGSIVSE